MISGAGRPAPSTGGRNWGTLLACAPIALTFGVLLVDGHVEAREVNARVDALVASDEVPASSDAAPLRCTGNATASDCVGERRETLARLGAAWVSSSFGTRRSCVRNPDRISPEPLLDCLVTVRANELAGLR